MESGINPQTGYTFCELEWNCIGALGCGWLAKADWPSLRTCYLCMKAIIKRAIQLAGKASNSYLRASGPNFMSSIAVKC